MIYILLLIILFIYIIRKLIVFLRNNNDGRLILLKLIGWIKNIPVQIVTDSKIAQEVLKTSVDKGYFIEHLVAMEAWKPIISLESVNGDAWKFQKKIFLELVPHLPPTTDLKLCIGTILSEYSSDAYIDSKQLTKIIVKIMIRWLFKLEFKDEWDFLVDASNEWRKEIAIKGKADLNIKNKTVELFKKIIFESKYYHIFGDKWMEAPYYSLFLQPFIISPMINISDIAVQLKLNPRLTILEAIHYAHPFPILERYIGTDIFIGNQIVVKAGTQVFIPLDLIGQKFKYENMKWTPFGLGDRSCAGQIYALGLMNPLFENLKTRPNYYPELNHKYSGRNNDNSSLDIRYFISTIIKIIIKSIIIK